MDVTSGLSILLHGVISIPDATSYDNCNNTTQRFLAIGKSTYSFETSVRYTLKYGVCCVLLIVFKMLFLAFAWVPNYNASLELRKT